MFRRTLAFQFRVIWSICFRDSRYSKEVVVISPVGPLDISLGGDVIQRLRKHSNLAVRRLCDDIGQGEVVPDLAQIMGCEKRTTVEQFDAQQHKIAQLSAWADVLVQRRHKLSLSLFEVHHGAIAEFLRTVHEAA